MRTDTALITSCFLEAWARAHNHEILIAQTQKIGILQVVTSDED